MEPRFGHDFSRVRVHSDVEAARAAGALSAQAFARGSDIVFGAGRFRPETLEGRRLIAHELVHVVQQRQGTRSGTAGGASQDDCEQHANAVVDQIAAGRDITALVRAAPRPGRAGPQRKPDPNDPQGGPGLDYHRDPIPAPVQPAGLTTAWVKNQLDQKVRAGEISSYTPTPRGVPPGSPIEPYVLAGLWGFAEKRFWNQEFHRLIDLGPSGPGKVAQRGQAIIRLSAQGAASIELVSQAGIPLGRSLALPDAISQLKALGFHDVIGWSSPDELSQVVAAVELLRVRAPADVAALQGVDLTRVAALTTKPGEAGEFLAHPPGGGPPYLALSNLAFVPEPQFFGSGGAQARPASFFVVLHEIGHAVEEELARKSGERLDHANADVAQAKKRLDTSTGAARSKARKDLTLAEKAEDAAKTARAASLVDPNPIHRATAAARKAATHALNAADAAVQRLPAGTAREAATQVVARLRLADGQIDSFGFAAVTSPTLDTLRSTLAQQIKTRGTVVAPPGAEAAAGPLQSALQAQDNWLKAELDVARTVGRTLRLQKFVDLVTANDIRRFTTYARQNWPDNPEEFFAEAYALWLTDPDFLQNNYPKIHDFFEGGDYRR
jgi:hypothetical protein